MYRDNRNTAFMTETRLSAQISLLQTSKQQAKGMQGPATKNSDLNYICVYRNDGLIKRLAWKQWDMYRDNRSIAAFNRNKAATNESLIQRSEQKEEDKVGPATSNSELNHTDGGNYVGMETTRSVHAAMLPGCVFMASTLTFCSCAQRHYYALALEK